MAPHRPPNGEDHAKESSDVSSPGLIRAVRTRSEDRHGRPHRHPHGHARSRHPGREEPPGRAGSEKAFHRNGPRARVRACLCGARAGLFLHGRPQPPAHLLASAARGLHLRDDLRLPRLDLVIRRGLHDPYNPPRLAPALPVHDIVDPRPDRHRRHDLSGKSGFLQGLRRMGLALRPDHRDHRLFHRAADRPPLFQEISGTEPALSAP
ncbi:Hypothetical protein GOX0915 [Gluconobacter oxydans 621H]|uniref:Uncharacterized protein n=1 Tax=Gluconobacter oxydans (strain 621H) TaxID=290633 RepID=Q5FSF9_GLUOX|nr:Hypothetical protein GOX0915 [Gluconobacter oxydans 621H]